MTAHASKTAPSLITKAPPPEDRRFAFAMKRSNTIYRTLLALVVLSALAPTHQALGDWPQRRGPANNGISAESGWTHTWPKEGPPLLWSSSVGTGFSAVTVANGLAYTLGNTNGNETVFAFDALTGAAKWNFSYPEPLNPKMYEGGPNSTPTVHRGQLLVTSRTGKVFCLDAAKGSLVWSNDLARYVDSKNGDWGVGGSPLVSGSRLFVNYGSAMVALDLASGKALWQSAKDSKGKYSFTSPVLSSGAEGAILFAHMHKAIFGLSPGDGRVLWRHEFGSGYETHSSDPVVTPAGVFISSGDDGGELISFTADKAARLWKNKNLGTFTGTAVNLGQYLYGVDSGGYQKGRQELRCVDLATGNVKWSLPGFGQDSLIAEGDRLIVLTDRGELVVVGARPGAGEVLARAQVLGGKCWTQPALSNGLLYCRNAKGEVVCIDLRPPRA